MITRAVRAGTGERGFVVNGAWLPDDMALIRPHMACTAAQARLALASVGMLDIAATAVGASNDAQMQIAWEYGTEWRRDDPRLTALALAIGLTDADIDDLFLAAMGA